MAVSYRLEGDVVVITAEGEYAQVEIPRTWERAERDPAYPAEPRLCLDMRGSASVARRPPRELRDLSNWFLLRAQKVGGRFALVTRPGVQYGLMRMASTWLELKGVQVHLCQEVDEAVAWLGQPEEDHPAEED